MSRAPKILLFSLGLVFMLACALVTNPINDVKNTANTAQAIVTDAVGLATQAAPLGTLIANPSLIPDVGNYFDPQGTPVAEWNGIPVMPQATAGQEFTDPNPSYSFKINATAQEVKDYYDAQMPDIGWNAPISIPVQADGGALAYLKDGKTLT